MKNNIRKKIEDLFESFGINELDMHDMHLAERIAMGCIEYGTHYWSAGDLFSTSVSELKKNGLITQEGPLSEYVDTGLRSALGYTDPIVKRTPQQCADMDDDPADNAAYFKAIGLSETEIAQLMGKAHILP